ncbi:MAG: CocE/NonD family hydrolase [Hyphomicrobiales bacterium]
MPGPSRSPSATVREDFPYAVDTIDPYWVTLKDGTRIACTLWRPRTDARVPVVIEAIPYRRRDGTVYRDLELHPYIAGHGIAYCRMDLRGAGDSDGILADEYLPQEQEDICEVIAHLAAEAWCNGNVGQTGISWGGFNSLQVAARRPPALKAIITLCSTDDRYADDVHYMGGALLTENEMWSNFMLAEQTMPPDPQVVGERWRDMWMARLEAATSLSETWLAHQRRDDYWKQGSVCEDFSRITCAVMAVCGWEDSYSNSVPRLLEGLTCPKQAIMGPWTHTYPCRVDPGPHIGWLKEALRWWRQWLLGEDTGILAEPMYRVWIGEAERPRPWYREHAGRWAAEEAWPSPRLDWRTLHLNAAGLRPQPEDGPDLSFSCPATAGTDYGRWGGYGGEAPDLAVDQRREDGLSLTFDTPPLEADLTLLGAVELDLEIVVDKPQVNLAARLCDVFPDGTSAVFTYGVLNLAHRTSHEHPEPCPVGKPFRVRLTLNDIGRTIPKGHRLRLALQNQFWFVLWPQPELSMFTLASGRSTMRLPVRPPSPLDAKVRFEPPEISAPARLKTLRVGYHRKTVEDDIGTGLRTITLDADFGESLIEDRAIAVGSKALDVFTIHPDEPLSAKLVSRYEWTFRSGPADVSGSAQTQLTSDAQNFHVTWEVIAKEGEAEVFRRRRTRTIPRSL